MTTRHEIFSSAFLSLHFYCSVGQYKWAFVYCELHSLLVSILIILRDTNVFRDAPVHYEKLVGKLDCFEIAFSYTRSRGFWLSLPQGSGASCCRSNCNGTDCGLKNRINYTFFEVMGYKAYQKIFQGSLSGSSVCPGLEIFPLETNRRLRYTDLSFFNREKRF